MGKPATKIVKAYCEKTGQYFALEVDKFVFKWKVVNFLPMSAEESSLVTSEVSQSEFYTNENLLACPNCKTRKIGGCSCVDRRGCRGADKELINCAYCKHLKLDYSAASYSGSHKEGDVIRLSQGQEVKIKASGGGSLEHVEVVCGWDPSITGDTMDVDSSVVVMGQSEYDLVFFGNLSHRSGCVQHHGDDLYGGQTEHIDVYFKKVPRDKNKLVFVVNIYRCADKNQTLGDVRNMFIQLREPGSQKVLVEYKEMGNMSRYTAIVLGVASKRGDEWFFKAEGAPSTATDVQGLARDCYNKYNRS